MISIRHALSLLVALAACSGNTSTALPDAASDLGLDATVAPDVAAPDAQPLDAMPDGTRIGRCTANSDCTDPPDRPVCDTATGLCVGCLATPADTCPTGLYCDPSRHCLPGCRDDAECVGRGASLRCDLARHACVGCVADRDCALGTVCSEGVCTPGCSAMRGCPTGASCCVTSCFSLGTDPLNCGACGHACATGEACCSGRCVSTASDAAHCGACGAACALPNATPVCVAGACATSSCGAGFGDCDRSAANGCEVALDSNLSHCGACGRTCPGGPNASPTCTRGACGLRCDAGWGDCDADPTNGCETNLNTTATACSSCTTVCATANATPACVAGRCAIGACVPGFADCDGLVANGCETAITTSANCGVCGTVCGLGEVCSTSSCARTCAGSTTSCGSACADLGADPTNCGACGRACAPAASARATCASGVCAFACDAGYGDCDGAAANGCETNLTITEEHCGACGRVCARPPNASASCAAGACALGACNAGFGDCDGDAANGCESALATSTAHCGACRNACPTPANATASCAAGACGFTCNAGFVRVGAVCAAEGTCPTARPYPSAGLVGAYELELDGRDASAARSDGTVVAPVTFGAGAFCNAAIFTAGGGAIDLPDGRLAAVTVSVRVRYDGAATTYQPIVDAWGGDENFLLGLDFYGGALRYTAGFHERIDAGRVYPEVHAYSTAAVTRGEWHHVAMSYDGATLRLYVDGVEQSSSTTNRTAYAAPAARVPDLRVGRSERSGTTIAAGLDHVLLYNRALTAAEIAAL